MTTIDLSDNHLNGSIPESFSDLPLLQRLSLENNLLIGSVHFNLWQNKSFSSTARLMLDLRNNLLLNISGDLNPQENVTLRLRGNPICSNTNVGNINQFCGSEAIEDDTFVIVSNATITCPTQACPVDNNYEYVPSSPVPCFCASPFLVGYRLKSPSFSHFPPHLHPFKEYMTTSLGLDLYQLSIEYWQWEKGPRLRMSLKLFPKAALTHSRTFNITEILRIREIFTSWIFPGNDFFGPYELLNFTLLGPYSYVDLETSGKAISNGMLIAIVLVAVVFSVAISAVITIFITRRHARYMHEPSRKHLPPKVFIKIEGVKSFTFEEMAEATHDFSSSSLVGQGGYGNVYRGTLFDNTLVAIKRAREGSLRGEKEFLTEIEMLSRLHHRNLVSLVGYCEEEGEQMLVYEFMPNGTLGDWLSAKSVEKLKFGMRLQIALDSAKGILYLHTDASPPIFHRDIKSSNILLDSRLNAKVADFGLSRLAPVLEDDGTIANHVSTLVKGTPGYVDPEYFLTHKLTDKSDVYSLGVVFLEILTGMKPIAHGKNIVREVNSAHRSGTMFSMIDSKMGSYPSECVERFIALAIRCCHVKPEVRPAMLDIVRELENILQTMPAETGINSRHTMPEIANDSVGFRSRYYGESSSSSLLHYSSRGPYVSSNALGSDLVSGVIPTITPR